jgi:hypothetical protein
VAIESVIGGSGREVYRQQMLTFTFEDADQASLAGRVLEFRLLDDPASSSALVTRTIGSGITLDGTYDYRATITLSAANLTRDAGEYYYAIVDTGVPTILAHGPFHLSNPYS